MDSNICIYETEGWSLHKKIKSQGWRTVYAATFFTQSETVVFGGDAILRVWDFNAGHELFQLEGHTKQVRCVAVTRDDRYVCSGGHDRCARIFDLKTQKCVAKLDGHSNFVITLKLTPDDKLLVTGGSDSTVRIWDVEEKMALAIMRGHSGYIKGLVVSRDGKYVVSSSLDKTLRVWDIEHKKQVGQMTDQITEMDTVAISSDMQSIYCAGKGYNDIVAWHFMDPQEREAFRRSPIARCVENYKRRRGIEYDGSPYAYKF